jgi:hypothetical protein
MELPRPRPAPAAPSSAPLRPPEELTTEPYLPPDKAPFIPPFEPGASVKPRKPRTPEVPAEGAPLSRTTLWIGIGVASGLVLLAVVICVWLFAYPGPDRKPQPQARKPIRVTRQTSGGLAQALTSAQDGDRIIIETDLVEASVWVRRIKDLTIEASEGKPITWKAPDKLDAAAKLLTIENCTGITLRNIRFEGEDRPMALMQIWGACDGLKVENVDLNGGRMFNLLLVNAGGTADAPLTFKGVRFSTSAADRSAVHFMAIPNHATVPRNDHLIFRDCKFTGPGHKFTRRADTDNGKNIEFPDGLSAVPWDPPLPK